MPTAAEPGPEPQSARAVLMVRPARFGFNPQTAASNAFQQGPDASRAPGSHESALQEFDHMAKALQHAGVEVWVVADTPEPLKPDAVFPNNWVSFHADGTVVLYPMMAVNRRCERREEVLHAVVGGGRFRVSRTVDLSHREAVGKFLEGTGSMVLDRTHRLAYASPSPRTDMDVLGEFAQLLDFELVTFDAQDAAGRPVYHTNVVMAVGSRFAVLCAESIVQAAHRSAVTSRLRATGHEVIELTSAQMREFAGNVLELSTAGGPVLALSMTALRSLDAAQRRALEAHAGLLPLEIPTIERLGGGGVRCMLAEIHLLKRD